MISGKQGALLGVGFLLGSLGLKVLKSEQAKKVYVQGIAAGIRTKNAYQDIVEQAKAEVDDIVAEAAYIADKDAEKETVSSRKSSNK